MRFSHFSYSILLGCLIVLSFSFARLLDATAARIRSDGFHVEHVQVIVHEYVEEGEELFLNEQTEEKVVPLAF